MAFIFYDDDFTKFVSRFETNDAEQKNINFDFTFNFGELSMTEQLIAPPAHIWDRIEKVLDQQENHRKQGTEIINSTYRSSKKMAVSKYVYASVAGAGLLAGVVWLMV